MYNRNLWPLSKLSSQIKNIWCNATPFRTTLYRRELPLVQASYSIQSLHIVQWDVLQMINKTLQVTSTFGCSHPGPNPGPITQALKDQWITRTPFTRQCTLYSHSQEAIYEQYCSISKLCENKWNKNQFVKNKN